MDTYTLRPNTSSPVVIERPISVKEENIGTVPYSKVELIMKIFTDMDNEFSEMSKILKSRNRAPWRK